MKYSYLLIISLFCAAFALPIGAQTALAHATPITYSPQESSVNEIKPENVEIVFSERIEQKASGISVFSPEGEKITIGKSRVSSSNKKVFSVGFQDKGHGVYTASWQVVSADDGHFTKGAFAFIIGEGGEIPPSLNQIQVQHATKAPQAASVGLEILGYSILLGIIFLTSFVIKKNFPFNARSKNLYKKLKIYAVFGALFVFFGSASYILLKSLDLASARGETFSETLSVFTQTNDGSFAVARIIIALLIISIFLFKQKLIIQTEKITKVEYVLFFLIAASILARAKISHAAASSFLPDISVVINAFQLFAKELWVGSVIVIAFVLIPYIWKNSDTKKALVVFSYFSRVSAYIIGIALVSGIYILWLHGKDIDYILREEWGKNALLLISATVIMGALRLYHIIFLQKANSPLALKLARATFSLEALVGLIVIFATAISILTTPFYPQEKSLLELEQSSQGATIYFGSSQNRKNHFYVKANSQNPINKAVITILNKEKDLGPILIEPTRVSENLFVFPYTEMSVAGTWNVRISVQRQGSYDTNAEFVIEYPKSIEGATKDNGRSFGRLELIAIILAIAGTGFAFAIKKYSQKSIKISEKMKNENAPPNINRATKVAILIAGIIVIISILLFIEKNILTSNFQKACEENGDFWVQSIPALDYKLLSSETATGCSLAFGFSHFTNQEEYEYFILPKNPVAELKTRDEILQGQETKIQIQIASVEDGKKLENAPRLNSYHNRILHAVIVGEDMKTFAHIHPEDVAAVTESDIKEGIFTLKHTFKSSGKYAILVNYVVGGKEFQEIFPVRVEGENPLKKEKIDYARTKNIHGYTIKLNAPKKVRAGEKIRFSYDISKNGKPVNDLEPYLAAASHIVAIRQDLVKGTHTHGEVYPTGSMYFQKYFQILGIGSYHAHFTPDNFGPRVEAGISSPFSLPSPGVYYIFAEFSHSGKIIVAPFAIEVE